MEDAMVLNQSEQENETLTEDKKSIIVKETKETAMKLWKGAVKIKIGVEKVKLKLTPTVLKVASVIAPECAPVCLAVAKFLKSDAGKKYIEITERNYDALERALTGDLEGAKEKVKENIDSLSDGKGDELIDGIKDTVDEIKGMKL